jgi:4-carboxymuconolactone decarboxylase
MDQDRFERGQRLRREVLGDAYVDRSLTNATEFTRPFQEIVTEFAWGEVWQRPGLDKKTRAMLNLAMLTALGRTDEVRLYARSAPNVGLTREDIQEVLIHAMVYCGVPAALDSFRACQEVFKEIDGE